MRDQWKAKRKSRGFSDWIEYFDYLIKNDSGNMMDEKPTIEINELKALKDLNKTLLSQVQLLIEQLKNFDYLTQLEALNKKINNHIISPKMEMVRGELLSILDKTENPLTVSEINEKLNREDISEMEILTALTDLAESKRIKLNFHNQTYRSFRGDKD